VLSFADEPKLKVAHGAEHGEHQSVYRAVVAREGHRVADKLDCDPRGDELLDRSEQVAHVAREAVHRVDDEGVALAHVVERRLQLQALRILALALSVNTPSYCCSVFWSTVDSLT